MKFMNKNASDCTKFLILRFIIKPGNIENTTFNHCFIPFLRFSLCLNISNGTRIFKQMFYSTYIQTTEKQQKSPFWIELSRTKRPEAQVHSFVRCYSYWRSHEAKWKQQQEEFVGNSSVSILARWAFVLFCYCYISQSMHVHFHFVCTNTQRVITLPPAWLV